MSSAAYEKFLASQYLTREQVMDGEGYDLDALGQIEVGEYALATRGLISRYRASTADWRDVEALGVMAGAGVPMAISILQEALEHRDPILRLQAATQLDGLGVPVDWDQPLVAAIPSGMLDSGFSRALDLAEEHPSDQVRQALLTCARHGKEPEARVNAAAMVLFLAGKAVSASDWDHRPFLLRFGEDNPREVESAWRELCDRVAA